MAKWTFIILLFINACAGSLKEYGRLYFLKKDKIAGVEPLFSLNKRLSQEKELTKIVYGSEKLQKIISCTILRNQLYVAGLYNPPGQMGLEIKTLVREIEDAYQQNDEIFLDVCNKISNEHIGKEFLKLQMNERLNSG